MKNKLSFAFTLALILSMVFNSLAFADVRTDMYIYTFGDTVYITGSEMQPGETVAVEVLYPDGSLSQHHEVAADSLGNFSDAYFVALDAPGGIFTVTAAGQTSGISFSTTFDPPTPKATITVTASPAAAMGGTFKITRVQTNGNDPQEAGGKTSQDFTAKPGTSFSVTEIQSPVNGCTYKGSPTVTGTAGADNSITVVTLTYSCDTTAPVISYILAPAAPDGSNGWYKTNQNITLTWSVTDAESSISSKTGCVNQTITADQAATDYSCSATSGGGSSGPVTVTIKRDSAAPGITWSQGAIANGASFVYGAVPAAPTCAATDVTSGPDTCAVTGYGTAVGSYTLTAAALDKAGNVTTQTRTYTVTQADAACAISGFSGAYDGAAHGASGSCLGVGGEDAGTLDKGQTFTDVPGGTAKWSFTGSANYKSQSGSVEISISQAASTVTLTCPASVTYTGSALEPCTATVAGAGGLSETLTVSYTDNTAAGTATASASYAGDKNHAGDSKSATFAIAKAASAVAVTCPASVTFDGSARQPCTAEVTGAGELKQPLPVSYTANVNVGTVTASASYAGDANHEGNSGSSTFKIEKASSSVTVTCPDSVTYNGAAQAPCTAAVTGAGGLSQTLPVGYTANVNAGPVTASASFAGDDNHTQSSGSATFSIAKAGSSVTVTCGDGPFTYSGAEQKPCSANATGAGGLNQPLAVTYTDNVDAGTATASAEYAGDANHDGSSSSATFAIGKAASLTTVTCDDGPFTYTGSAQEPCKAEATGVGGLKQSLDVTYSNNTNAGTASASAAFAGDKNHDGSEGSASFTIAKAASTTTVTCPEHVTYTGSAQEPCTAEATGAGGLKQEVKVSYTANTAAGTANASAAFTGDDNHEGSSGSAAFTIDRAASITTVTCEAGPFVYSGSAQTPCTAEVTGAGGLKQSLEVVYGNNINAGEASARASYAGDDNHFGSEGSETFTIDKAGSTVTVTCPANVTYNATAQTPCTAAVTGAGALNQPLSVSYTDNTNAGKASASAVYAGDANHYGNNGSATFTIDRAASTVTVTCLAGPFTYTGSAQAPCSATAAGVGGLSQSLTVSYTDNINAGQVTASANFEGDSNHDGNSGAATFTIEKAASTTSVSCPANVTYTGSALEPCTAAVTGAGGLNQSLTVSYSSNTNAGTASASASYAGDDNHLDSEGSASFTIDKAPSETRVTCGAGPFVYSGSAQTPCTAEVTGAGGLKQSLDVTYRSNISAGAASASASYSGDDNHKESSGSATFTIAKADAACTVTGYTVYFDSSAHTAAGSCVGVLKEPLSGLSLSATTHTLVGKYTDSWTFTDATGNYKNAAGTVADEIMTWTFGGFYQPVDMTTGAQIVWNKVKSGSTVPLKFKLFAGPAEITSTSAIAPLKPVVSTCSSGFTDDIEVTATGGTVLRYDTTGGQFIYNWQTPKAPGACYLVTVKAVDGSSISAYFQLK